MDLVQLVPRLHFIRLPVGHAYLWHDPDGLTHLHPNHIGAAAEIVSQGAAQPVIPTRIDRQVTDGDELGFGDSAVVVAVPGHTPGSIAVHLPRHQVLFTGDAAARRPDGTVICGIFNVDRARAAASLDPQRVGPAAGSALSLRVGPSGRRTRRPRNPGRPSSG